MRYLVFGIAFAALATLLIIYLIRRGSRDDSGTISLKRLSGAVARTCLLLLVAGAVIMFIGYAMAGFDLNGVSVQIDDVTWFDVSP